MVGVNRPAQSRPGQTGWFHQSPLYQAPANTRAFHDITRGNNGSFSNDKNFYSAGPGWDACTGWGSPKGTELLKALGG